MEARTVKAVPGLIHARPGALPEGVDRSLAQCALNASTAGVDGRGNPHLWRLYGNLTPPFPPIAY